MVQQTGGGRLGQITCPECSFQTSRVMPEDRCLYFFECPGCRVIMRPRSGDCCVFCSFGSVRCPPRQGAGD